MSLYNGYFAESFGLDPMGSKAVKGNRYGDWEIDQNANNYNKADLWYSLDTKITFIPNPKNVCCKEIAFIQTARLLSKKTLKNVNPQEEKNNRINKNGWIIDRAIDRKSPWYGFVKGKHNKFHGTLGSAGPGIPTVNAVLTDEPGWSKFNTLWEFETHVICKEGKDKNKLYGVLT